MTVKLDGQTAEELGLKLLRKMIADHLDSRKIMCYSVSVPLYNGACMYCTFQGLNCARLVNIRESIK